MIEIVRLQPGHFEALTVFYSEINVPEYTKYFSPHPFDQENARRICNHKGLDQYYAIVRDCSEIIGYGMLRGWDEGYSIPSLGLCISKKYSRIGLGRLLLSFLERAAALAGAKKIMLKVKKDNYAAQKIYEDYEFNEFNEEFLMGYKTL